MLWSQKTLAEQNLDPEYNLSCLTQDQKKAIAQCFEETQSCENTLMDKTLNHELFGWNWKIMVWSAAIGVIGGMVLEHELVK